ncbi:hypothetical protein D3C87_1366920 [compost metagenome]
MQRPFHGNRVGFDKQGFIERHQLFVDRAGRDGIALQRGIAHVGHVARRDVGGHRDIAFAAQQHQLDRGGVVAGYHQEVLADAVDDGFGTGHVAGGFLDADDVFHGRQADHGVGQHVARGAARHVIQDLRDVDGFGDGLEVLVQAFLGRLVVIRSHQQAGIGAGDLRIGGQLDGFTSRVRASPGDHRNAPCNLLHHVTNHFDVLVHVKGGRFTCSADRHDGVGAVLQVKVHQFAQAVPVETTLCIHGCDQCHHTARNHATAPAGKRER